MTAGGAEDGRHLFSRLLQPRHVSSVELTAEAGIPWACDNDAFNGWDADAERRYVNMLDRVAEATDELSVALAALGAAYEQLDTNTADRLEEQLFRPPQLAYGRARRVHSGFAERVGRLATQRRIISERRGHFGQRDVWLVAYEEL